MKVSYFPGCTLRTKAKELDFYARKGRNRLQAFKRPRLKIGKGSRNAACYGLLGLPQCNKANQLLHAK